MDQDVIRRALLQQLVELTSRSDRIDAHWRDQAPPKDWEELATHRENDEVIESLDERTRAQILEIKQAIARMDAGEWQICAECGADIQPARLKILPTTTRCVNCAETQEHTPML